NSWMVSFTSWLVSDETFGCARVIKDEAMRSTVADLGAVLARGDATEREILDAGREVMNLLCLDPELPEATALSAAVNVATSRGQFARSGPMDDHYLVRWLKSAVVSLACVQDNVEEFQVAIADKIEQAMYPGRAPYGRAPGCPTARMLREQALSAAFSGK